jgi:hypothetical protein
MDIAQLIVSLKLKTIRIFPPSGEFTDARINLARRLIRRGMVVRRGGAYAKCDQCGSKESLHMHELINRARTPDRSVQRWLSYQPELAVIICEECHREAHNPEARSQLFKLNYKRHGYEDVKMVFDALIQFAGNVGIELPDPEREVA